MGVSSSESHDLTAFYEMLLVSFGVLSQNTGFYPSLDRIIETMLGPLNLGPGGGSYNEPISRLHRLFLEHVWRHHRLPEEVISDHGPAFVSNFSCELAALLGVKLTPSTSYHLQTDGQTEHVNQEIEAYLRVFVSHRQDDWADWLPLAEFAYNNKVHAATHRTLFKLDAGQHPRLGVEPMRTSTVEAVDTFTRRLDHAQEAAKATLERAADDMKRYYDRNHQAAPEYKVGD